MTSEENTEEGRIRRIINDKVKLGQTGQITEVKEHTDPDDPWNFHVDVRIDGNTHPRKVPVAVPFPDMIAPPRSTSHPDGPDLAFVQYMEDDDEPRPIVTHILYNDVDRALLGQEGVIRAKRGSLYFEMHPDGDWARLSKKTDDDGSPTMTIEIDDANNEIQIDADSNSVEITADVVNVNGGGTIVATEGDSISGNGHNHGGEVSSDTISGSIDSKGDGDIEVNQ